MPEAGAKPSGRLLLYVVSEDWFFASHFLPMARTAMRLGYEVALATRVTGHADAIMSEGIRVIPVNIERSGLGPVAIGRQIRQLTRLMRRERPTLVHCIALRVDRCRRFCGSIRRRTRLGFGGYWSWPFMGEPSVRHYRRAGDDPVVDSPFATTGHRLLVRES